MRKPSRTTYIACLIPPPNLRQEFARVAAHAPQPSDIVREEDLHITLNTIHLSQQKPRAGLLEAIEKITFPAFTIDMTDADTFNRAPRKNDRSKVAWLRPDGCSSHDIQELSNRIMAAVRAAGHNVGELESRPHMTVVRYAPDAEHDDVRSFLRKAAESKFPHWDVDEFYLARRMPKSDSKHPCHHDGQGSQYEIIASFPLTKPA